MVGRLVIAIVFSALVVSASLAEDSEPAEAPSISAAELAAPGGVALYCRVGPRPRMGESALLAAGYEKVFHLEGGLAAWQAAGLPVDDTR